MSNEVGLTKLASQTARLAWLLFPHTNREQNLAMLAGYFDDTCTHGGSEIVAVAGYFAPADEWDRVEAKWNALLAAEGILFYHSVKCAQGVGQFADWPKERRNRVHREVVEIITGSGIVPVGVSIAAPSVAAMVAEELPDEEPQVEATAFYWCLGSLLRWLGGHVAGAKQERISVVLEDSPKALETTHKIYQFAVGQYPWLAASFEGPPLLRPKLGFPQLQAADVLAYEMGLDLRRFYAPTRSHKTRGSFSALVEHSGRVQGMLMHHNELPPPP